MIFFKNPWDQVSLTVSGGWREGKCMKRKYEKFGIRN